MRLIMTGLLAVALLAGPVVVNAANVTWQVTGTFGSLDDPGAQDIPGCVTLGSPFVVSLSFDPTTSLLNTFSGVTGARYTYSGSSLGMSLYLPSCSDTLTAINTGGATGSSIVLLDNFSTISNPTARDGLLFTLVEQTADTDRLWTVAMIGTYLDMFTGPGLPSVPDPRLVAGAPRYFDICGSVDSCLNGDAADQYEAFGRLSGIAAVPEPGTLALLGLGLAGLGFSRRRKA